MIQIFFGAFDYSSWQCVNRSLYGDEKNFCIEGIPEPGAILNFELWKNQSQNSTFYVKIDYDNKYLPMCGQKKYECEY
jgi:hypothetical protein